MKKIGLKILKISSITTGILLAIMLLFPYLYPNKIETEVKKFANQKINGELKFNKAKVSFFEHFPSLTLTLTDFELYGSKPFSTENLVNSKELSFAINVKSLVFGNKIIINKVYLDEANFSLQVNKKGENNYNIYKTEETNQASQKSETALNIENISISKTRFVYDDKSTKISINANGFNYEGKGDLSKAIFELQTTAKIDDFNFTFDNKQYLQNKVLNASLITKINTNSLSLEFKENNLMVNKLPIDFIGKFDFVKNGYYLDFNILSKNSELNDFFTALPPEYVKWLQTTNVAGTTDIVFTLKGNYIESENKKPDLKFNMNIRNGAIKQRKSNVTATNIYMDFESKIPQLNMASAEINLDSLFLNVGKDFLKSKLKIKGLDNPSLETVVKSNIDLQQLNKALGIQNIDCKGKLIVDLNSKGIYNKITNKIPITNATFNLKNGYLKTKYYPNAIKNINLLATVLDKNGTLNDLNIKINPATFNFEGKPIFVKAFLSNFENIKYNIKAKGTLDVAKIYKVFAVSDLKVKGYINANVSFEGSQYDAEHKNYKNLHNSGTLILQDITTNSSYLPKPFLIKNGTFTFYQDKMKFQNFEAEYGKSNFAMNGYLENTIGFVLSSNSVLKGHFDLQSKNIFVDEFMTASKNENTTSKSIIEVPQNLNLNFNCDADIINFDGLNLEKTNGNISISDGKIALKNTTFDLIGTKFLIDLGYKNKKTSSANFDFKINANDFDVKKAYNEIKMFRDMATSAQSAEGLISLHYQLSGVLDSKMNPIYPSIEGIGVLSVKKVKTKGFKLFNSVSKNTGRTAFNNTDLSKIDIKSSIKNNIITLAPFKFKVALFRPKIEGTTSLDGKLNLKMRLGLPPFGLFGIPLTITGTNEDPKVKIGKKTEDLEETEYVEVKKL